MVLVFEATYEGEDLGTLFQVRQADREALWHTAKDSRVDAVVRQAFSSIGNYTHSLGLFVAPSTSTRESVPVVRPSQRLRYQLVLRQITNINLRHEFGLHHSSHLVITCRSLAEQRVDLINEDLL